jgi:hypothetical protein
MKIFKNAVSLTCLLGAVSLGGCQTTQTAGSDPGGLADGADAPSSRPQTSLNVKRDDRASDAVERVFIQRATLADGAGAGLTKAEHRAVLREVDRQICFEISKRFTVVANEDADAALIRTSVMRISPTGKMGSGASAVAKVFIPVPMLNFRGGTLGGLAIESELLAPKTGTRVASIAWERDAQNVGMQSPSLSPVGDALQLAEPMGDAVAKAFASPARKKHKVATPDPCLQYGPRLKLTGKKVVGAVSGLYVPETEPDESPKN